MKFSSGVDQLQKEISFLKFLMKTLLLFASLLLALVWVLYSKDPILVERSSHGLELVTPTDFARTELDMKRAVTLMIMARFDTKAVSPELFLNPKQQVLRGKEQMEMKARGMNQTVIVRAVVIKRDEAIVDFDRILSVGDIRSALRTRITIAFEEQTPNELNPYGLLLSLADPLEQKQEK